MALDLCTKTVPSCPEHSQPGLALSGFLWPLQVLDLSRFNGLADFAGNLSKALIFKALACLNVIFQQSYPQKIWIVWKR
jgi:hypothetical protein